MPHIILADVGDLHFPVPFVLIFDADNIALRHFQQFCCLFTDDRSPVRKHILFLRLAVMEVHKFLHRFGVFKDTLIYRPLLLSFYQSNVLHIYIYMAVNKRLIIQSLLNLPSLGIRHIFLKIDAAVVHLDLRILQLRDLITGVFKPESHKHERHAAPDAEDRHEKSFLVSHEVSNCRFPDKAQMPPQKAYPLHQHPAPALWRRRAHQLRGLRRELPKACHECSKHRTENRSSRRHYPITPVIRNKDYRQMPVENPVCIYDNIGKNLFPRQDSDDAASYSSQESIAQIL